MARGRIGQGGRGWVFGRLALLLVLCLGGLGGGLNRPQGAAAAPTITEIGVGAAAFSTNPGSQIVAAPDGTLWFTLPSIGSIGRISPAGVQDYFHLPATQRRPQGMAVGADGAIWFTLVGQTTNNPAQPTERYTDTIGRITSDGVITEFPLPGLETNGPLISITNGPDGALWFVASSGPALTPVPFNNAKIGRITTAGALTLFPVDMATAPAQITAGPDGALWFTQDTSYIGRIATDGTITSYFTDYSLRPRDIVAGPDGALWFTTSIELISPPGRMAAIGRMTTAGAFTHTPLPGATALPTDIAPGPDGALWFTEVGDQFNGPGAIGRMTTANAFTEYPTAATTPYGIVAGPDDALWFGGSAIGRITTTGTRSSSPYRIVNQPVDLAMDGTGAIWMTLGDQDRQLLQRSASGSYTTHTLPTGVVRTGGIALGQDGALWFTDPFPASAQFGRITTAGATTIYPANTVLGDRLIVGSDGAFWAVASIPTVSHGLARLTTTGAATMYTTMGEPATVGDIKPESLTVGADGAIWFAGRQARETTSQTVVGRFSPDGSSPVFDVPNSPDVAQIVTGADGALWFGISVLDAGASGKIGRMTTAGGYAEFAIAAGENALSLVAGPDGAIWFTTSKGKIGRITTDGALTTFPLSSPAMVPGRIILGLDGALWFTATDSGSFTTNYVKRTILGRIQVGDGPIPTRGPGQVQATTAGNQLSLVAAPNPGAAFVGWRDGDLNFQGWASPLTLTQAAASGASAQATTPFAPTAQFAAITSFSDLGAQDAETQAAIRQLAARGIIRGYQAEICAERGLAAPCFGPADPILRAQMAALIARAMPGSAYSGPGIGPFTWSTEDHQTNFTDRGDVDDNLWRNVGTLQHYNVARGFGDGTYHPVDNVAYIQVVSFVTRAMINKGYWQQQPDNPAVYPNVPLDSGHHQDLVTYLHYVPAGAAGFSPASTYDQWTQAGTRGWFALTLWRALDQYWGQDRLP